MNTEQRAALADLQRIDCNCNNCAFMQRDAAKYQSFDRLYTNEKDQVTTPSHRPQYGHCQKFDKPVGFLPGTCQIETQECFLHRRDRPTPPADADPQ